MARARKPYRVTITNVDRVVDCAPDQTVLHAAITAGIDYPYACASGNCGTCVSHLDAGNAVMLPRADGALSPGQAASGLYLACRSLPCSNITVTWIRRTEG